MYTKNFAWPGEKMAAISLTFDDGCPAQIDYGLPILDTYGAKASFYLSPTGARERLDGWKAALAAGHEIGNHTEHHPGSGNFDWARSHALEDYTLERISRDIAEGDETLNTLFGIRPATFAYPCGQKFVGRGKMLRSYVPVVAERFLAGRGFRDEAPNSPLYCDLAQLAGIEADSASLAELMSWVEIALKDGGWVVFVAHQVGDFEMRTMRENVLEGLCRYATDERNGIWIDTVSAVASHLKEYRRDNQ